MPEEGTQSCGNCRYMRDGMCCRYPPFNNVWPAVDAAAWCGEWSMVSMPYPAEPESDATEAVEKALGMEE